jgi:hypothetical protein
LAEASMMAVTSAWYSGQPVSSTRFCPRPMISPSLTITAPNGQPQPFSTDSMASLVASCMNLICPLAGTDLAGVAENPVPATPMAAAAAVRVKNARRPASVGELQVQRFMLCPLR